MPEAIAAIMGIVSPIILADRDEAWVVVLGTPKNDLPRATANMAREEDDARVTVKSRGPERRWTYE